MISQFLRNLKTGINILNPSFLARLATLNSLSDNGAGCLPDIFTDILYFYAFFLPLALCLLHLSLAISL